MKSLIAIIVACSACIISACSRNTINIERIIHANRYDVAENMLFHDIRKEIVELKQWPYEKGSDTIYAIESWNYEDGTFSLMYWSREMTISILQDNMGDSLVAYNRRAFTRRIIALVEGWDPEKILNHPGRVSPSQTLYATRIIFRGDEPAIVNTLCFPDIFLLEVSEDGQELFELWHPSKSYNHGQETDSVQENNNNN